MDQKFQLFEQWYQNQIPVWAQHNIVVDQVYQSNYAHQYHIEVYSDHGLGRISLYESNDIYWVDFKAGNKNREEMFFRVNLSYKENKDIMRANKAFIEYMNLSK